MYVYIYTYKYMYVCKYVCIYVSIYLSRSWVNSQAAGAGSELDWLDNKSRQGSCEGKMLKPGSDFATVPLTTVLIVP